MRDLSTQLEHSLDQRLAQSARMVSGLLDRVPATPGTVKRIKPQRFPRWTQLLVGYHRFGVNGGCTHPEMNDVLAVETEGIVIASTTGNAGVSIRSSITTNVLQWPIV